MTATVTHTQSDRVDPESGTLPAGWVNVHLSEVVSVLDNLPIPVNREERENRLKSGTGKPLYQYYGATGPVGLIDDYIYDGEYVLLGEDAAPFLDRTKPKAYISRGKFWVNNHAHVLQAFPSIIDNRYILHALNVFNYQHYVSGTTRLKLTQQSLNI